MGDILRGLCKMMNYLWFILDSCRYDVYEAAKTPNMDSVAPLEKMYMFSTWTVPSMMGLLLNMPPIGHPDQRLFRGHKGWLPTSFAKKGYWTAFLSKNVYLTQVPGVLDSFRTVKLYLEEETDDILPLIIKDYIRLQGFVSCFTVVLVMDTHTPYHWGESSRGWEDNPEDNFSNQVRSVEYVDRLFKDLLDSIHRETEVTIMADHGDLHGEDGYSLSHAPNWKMKYSRENMERLVEIPFIRGVVK